MRTSVQSRSDLDEAAHAGLLHRGDDVGQAVHDRPVALHLETVGAKRADDRIGPLDALRSHRLRQQGVDGRCGLVDGGVRRIGAEHRAFDAQHFDIGQADEAEQVQQVVGLEIERCPGAFREHAAGGRHKIDLPAGQQSFRPGIAIAEGDAWPGDMIEPRLELRGRAEIHHARAEHDHVGARQFVDERLGDVHRLDLFRCALFRWRDPALDVGRGDVWRRIRGEVAHGQRTARAGLDAFGDFGGEAGGKTVSPARTGGDKESAAHGAS